MNLVSNSQKNQFYKSDLDLDPMNLVLKLDLDMVKMYHHAKNEVTTSRHSEVIARTDRNTDTQTDNMKTLPSRIRGRYQTLSQTCSSKEYPWEETLTSD